MAVRMLGGNNQTDQYIFVQYQNVITLPISARCSAIALLLETAPLKELKYLFGKLVEDIFGFRTKEDWGFLTLDPSRYADYTALKAFLAVEGPVLQLSYKLLESPPAQYDFHVSCLPAPSRNCLERGTIPPFYANKISALSGGAVSGYLQLNSFEYFLFHFAYFIVNPTWKGYGSSVSQMETVYTRLLEEYLKYFLPSDGSPAPVLSPSTKSLSTNQAFLNSSFQRNASWNAGKNASASDHSCLNAMSPLSSQSPYLQQKQMPSLLKPGALEVIDSIPNFSHQGVSPLGASKSETWRSEEFLAILSEMYLNQGSTKQVQSIAGILKERFVPSHYHVYMVRVLIKHVHYFVNSFVPSTHILNGSPYCFDLLSELKSIVLPRLIQKNLHSFLKLTFDRWPLDDSFRVPLETWLSYIQPWRYTCARSQKEEEKRGFVNRWQKFVTENLHFYTPFLMQVLHRFSRMDLSCPKTAYMLFRTTKVFSQEDFDSLILRAEKHHLAAQSRSPFSTPLSPYANSQYSSSSAYLNETSILGHQGSQSPGLPGGCQELFNKNLIVQVTRLVSEIMSTREKAVSMKLVNGNGYKGFFSSLLSFTDDSSNIPAEDYYPMDSKKLILHLDASMQNLCKLFKLTPPTHTERPPNFDDSQLPEQSTANLYGTFRVNKLSPVKKIQPLTGKMRDKIEYRGNPDLQPVRTYEYEILVKMFNDVSTFLNDKYAEKIKDLYVRPSIVGRMCQQVLAAPTHYSRVLKSKDMQMVTIEKVHLPPRISLRILANKSVIWYFVLYFVLMYFMNFHPLSSLIIAIGLILIVVFIRALFIKSQSPLKVD